MFYIGPGKVLRGVGSATFWIVIGANYQLLVNWRDIIKVLGSDLVMKLTPLEAREDVSSY